MTSTLLHDKPLRVEVTRGPHVESEHEVIACAAEPDGKVLYRAGDIERCVYLRSSAKPFITAAIVRAGAAERFHFTPQEIAVITASHVAAPMHIAVVESILQKLGLKKSDLQCGPHAPIDVPSSHALIREGRAAEPIHNNCSGKHAGILALCAVLGVDHAGYLDVQHPAQQAILAMCGRIFDLAPENFIIGTDGCGIPVIALPLWRGAMGFARLASLEHVERADAKALEIVRDAMRAYPEYIRGEDAFDTALVRDGGGKIVVKSGGEGVFGAGYIERRCGLVLKVLDGNLRAGPAAFLKIAPAIDPSVPSAAFRAKHEKTEIPNSRGEAVGAVQA